MRIVPQLACVSYSSLPALCAPRIAGLLPAVVPSRPQETPPPFIFSDTRLTQLSTADRDRLYQAGRILFDVALHHIAGTSSDHALNTALALFRRAVAGEPILARNPAQYNAERDITLLEWASEWRS